MTILRTAVSAVLLLALAGCVGQAPAGTPGTPYPVAPAPSPTLIVFPTTSTCFHPLSAAPQAWLAVICPAADALVAAQAGLNTLQRAADGGQGEASVADAAYSAQEMTAVETPLDTAPPWTNGVGIVNDMFSAIATYRSAINDFRFAFDYSNADYRNQAHRLMTTAAATITTLSYHSFLVHEISVDSAMTTHSNDLTTDANNEDITSVVYDLAVLKHAAANELAYLNEHRSSACFTRLYGYAKSATSYYSRSFTELYYFWTNFPYVSIAYSNEGITNMTHGTYYLKLENAAFHTTHC